VRDILSGYSILRLVVLRNALRSHSAGLFVSEGWAANAELYWRAGRYARRVETVPTVERHDLRQRPSRVRAGQQALELWRARARLRAAPIPPPAELPSPEGQRPAEVVSS
jgi:hypothetical protein